MNYMLLIYGNENRPQTEAEVQAEMQGYNQFTEEVRTKGLLVAGEALHPTSTATTVKIREGKRLNTDGPFAETKEQLGGFYILNCKDLDEAISYAAKIPGAATGCVEVRPIVVWE